MLHLWQECLESESEDVNVELVQVKDFNIELLPRESLWACCLGVVGEEMKAGWKLNGQLKGIAADP